MSKVDMRDAFFERLVEVARKDERVIVLSADHGAFALEKFQEEMPDRYINMGIAEQNMVGVAAGLAASGKIVFIYGITPFVSLRVLEQLTLDVAAMQLPVNVISVGAGFTYSTDGPTHQGLQDVAAISTIPGMTILNSSDPINTRAFVDLAIKTEKPHYIRIEKEKLLPLKRLESVQTVLDKGFSVLAEPKKGVLLISTGYLIHQFVEIGETLSKDYDFILGIIDIHQLKPIYEIEIMRAIANYSIIMIFEEAYSSSIGSEISKIITKNNLSIKTIIVDTGDSFNFMGGSRDQMYESSEISMLKNMELVIEVFKENS